MATTEAAYKVHMKELEILSPQAHTYLVEKDPKTWSRAYYQIGRCCDAVENGCSESFNAIIVDARKKPIISMLEEIRIYMMNRLYSFKSKLWSTDTSPAIRKKLNEMKREQRFWHVLPSGQNKFEARSANEAFEVDLEKRTCACRLWQLNGYGCIHSVAAISSVNRKVEDYVDPMFKRDKYNSTYQYSILPMNGSAMWPETTYLPPLPPLRRKMPGRPRTKRIRSDAERVGKHKVSRVGRKVTCGICRMVGHNRSTCPNKDRPPKLPVRKSKAKDGEGTSQKTKKTGKAKKVANTNDGAGTSQGATTEVTGQGDTNEVEGQGATNEMAGLGSQGSTVVNGATPQESQTIPMVRRRKRKRTTPTAPVKRSERIGKLKLARRVHGKNGEGDSESTPLVI